MDQYNKLKQRQNEARIIQCAAIFIQKIWRGYQTRKKLHEQLRLQLVMEVVNKDGDIQELYNLGLGEYYERYRD